MLPQNDLGASLYKTWSDKEKRDEIARLVEGYRKGLPVGILCKMAETIAGSRKRARKHLQALLDEQARTTRQQADPLTQAGQTVPAPASPNEAIKMAATDVQDAQTAFSDALGSVSRYRAMLFATIAASLAGHQEALS